MLYISPLCSLIEELSVWKSFVKWFQSNSLLTHTVSWEQRQWHPIPVLLPGKSHGRRSLVGCSPWAHEESDMTEQLHFYFSLSCIGEGNGNPLQYSCLENPRDGKAWWAAIHGVIQSRTRLKWHSSSIMQLKKKINYPGSYNKMTYFRQII